MKKIILCKPFASIKSYSICLEDDEKQTITPLVYVQKSTFLDDDEYKRMMANMAVQFTWGFEPLVKEQS